MACLKRNGKIGMNQLTRDKLMILEGMNRAFGFFLEQPQFDCFESMSHLFQDISDELTKEGDVNGSTRKSD